ncbi:MAG: FHA domain-containing protein [Tannerella sp.]|jgi:S1-C subfamily serine protease|nr:FHA domain-containing protein [Tannerella sp.]
MAHSTDPYKRSFSGSVGAGLNALFGGSKRTYYMLEHKMSSKYHKAGETQEIIIDRIELGRDPRCQVRFDNTMTTISRRHAAIVRDGDRWKLLNLSETNPTLLNGRNVTDEWYLQNGDEIELSLGGPRLGFIIPTGKNAAVGSIKLTRRLSLFRKQALRPYKTAITILSILLLLSVAGLSGWLYMQDKTNKETIAALKTEQAAQEKQWQERFEDQKNEIKKSEAKADSIKKFMESKISSLQSEVKVVVQRTKSTNEAISKCDPYVYYIRVLKVEIEFEGRLVETDKLSWSGTGFLLDDGRFVTARHVVEPWFSFMNGGEIDTDMLKLNKIANNGGKIIAHFGAFSSSGDNFTFTSDQFFINRRLDDTGVDDDGYAVRMSQHRYLDWAYLKTSRTEGLKFDAIKSTSLERGEDLMVLGFPYNIGAYSPSDITPQLSSGITTARGLTENLIVTSNSSYERGNSGGPVFWRDSSGDLTVVGIVSSILGRSTGAIIPIAEINNY